MVIGLSNKAFAKSLNASKGSSYIRDFAKPTVMGNTTDRHYKQDFQATNSLHNKGNNRLCYLFLLPIQLFQ